MLVSIGEEAGQDVQEALSRLEAGQQFRILKSVVAAAAAEGVGLQTYWERLVAGQIQAAQEGTTVAE